MIRWNTALHSAVAIHNNQEECVNQKFKVVNRKTAGALLAVRKIDFQIKMKNVVEQVSKCTVMKKKETGQKTRKIFSNIAFRFLSG